MFPNSHTLKKTDVSGIHTVIRAYDKILPQYGIDLVGPDDAADIVVGHAGMGGATCDISMLHGIYFTDDYHATNAEWRANTHVVESIRRANIVTVPSEWVAETLRRDFRIDPIVIPHGVFLEEWQHNYEYVPNAVLWAKNRVYDVCDPTPINDIARRMPDVMFFTTFATAGSPGNVIEIGVQKHGKIKKWIARASVVISTVKETWGIMYAEAMAAGTPVVAANYGHVPNLIQHGVGGYCYNPSSIDDMEYGLRWTLKHHDILGANARKLAGELSWHEAGERFARVARLAVEMRAGRKAFVI
jgi:glycosyltransferase involved in cell wall biosynthesis